MKRITTSITVYSAYLGSAGLGMALVPNVLLDLLGRSGSACSDAWPSSWV